MIPGSIIIRPYDLGENVIELQNIINIKYINNLQYIYISKRGQKIKMMSGEMVVNEFLKDLKEDEKELKKSEKREKKITKEFNDSIKKLSFLL